MIWLLLWVRDGEENRKYDCYCEWEIEEKMEDMIICVGEKWRRKWRIWLLLWVRDREDENRKYDSWCDWEGNRSNNGVWSFTEDCDEDASSILKSIFY